jgi:hypothetical protein
MVLGRTRLRRPASLPVMVGIVIVVFGLLVVSGLVARRGSGRSHSSDENALVDYADAIYPATQQAGKVIVAGIRPDISDFQAGRISVQVWTVDMQTRVRELDEAKRGFDAARAPSSVKDAPRLFDRAFDSYQQAVRLFLDAAKVDGGQRADLIARGSAIGESGDHLFDQGTARIQAARRALGLAPDPRFSDAPAVTR